MTEPVDSWHRMGSCWSNPLDQWSAPEVDLDYPTRQELYCVNVRNLNRVFH